MRGRKVKASILRLSLLSVVALTACTTIPREPDAPSEFIKQTLIQNGELPAPTTCVIKKRIAYTICMDQQSHLASWVAYRLTKAGVVSEANRRKDNWKTDPEFPWLTSKVYTKSGFDKGHLAPAEDFESSLQAMNESFYYSNSAPQVHSYNAGIWLNAEKAARELALAHESALIATGPVIERGLLPFRDAAVIPRRFWKVVLVASNSEDSGGAAAINAEVAPSRTTVSNQKANSAAVPASVSRIPRLHATAWIIPTDAQRKDLAPYAVSVDEVERVTGLDLFSAYENQLEEQFESHNSADDGVTTATNADKSSW
ncbi:MAG: DNA/RNA non-specific endonuclease [Proteobacteria bacterium]|nr:MAG: DNA/RNA non-specific endonuclease [Pseudomonadota bacterium]